jgi:hypothetical protein
MIRQSNLENYRNTTFESSVPNCYLIQSCLYIFILKTLLIKSKSNVVIDTN